MPCATNTQSLLPHSIVINIHRPIPPLQSGRHAIRIHPGSNEHPPPLSSTINHAMNKATATNHHSKPKTVIKYSIKATSSTQQTQLPALPKATRSIGTSHGKSINPRTRRSPAHPTPKNQCDGQDIRSSGAENLDCHNPRQHTPKIHLHSMLTLAPAAHWHMLILLDDPVTD